MKKAKVLVSHYSGESGFNVHRVYLEHHFDQAQRDLDMIKEIEPCGKEIGLYDCEVFEPVERTE